jgi:hypothetical protein
MAQQARLTQGDQFSVTEGVLLPLSAVTAPANGSTLWIENHGSNGHFAPLACLRGKAQQPFHPPLARCFHQQ